MKLYLLKSPLIWMIFQNRNLNIASVFSLICAQVNVRGLDIVYTGVCGTKIYKPGNEK